MACRVVKNYKKEIVNVYAENGEVSQLYNDILVNEFRLQGNFKSLKQIKESALQLYATKDTSYFKEWLDDFISNSDSLNANVVKDSNNEVSAEYLLAYQTEETVMQTMDTMSRDANISIVQALEKSLNLEDVFVQDNMPVILEHLNKRLPGVSFNLLEDKTIKVLNPEMLAATYRTDTVEEVFNEIPLIIENLKNV